MIDFDYAAPETWRSRILSLQMRAQPHKVGGVVYVPEQSAELGSGTLTADDVLNAVYKHGARWQAIADELNAALGGGECKIVASATDGLTTDNPKKWFELSCGHTFKIYGLGVPVVCPVCGKAVKR